MITVVCIRSLSFTGTTWINLMLGCHERSLAIGPPDRVWEMPSSKAKRACLIHDAKCPLWPKFIHNRDSERNFFVQLAECSGKDVFVINNPTNDFSKKELDDPALQIRYIRVVRDGRANVASMMRHHPDRHANFYNAVGEWLVPALKRQTRQINALSGDALLLRHEDVIVETSREIKKVGDLIGINYPDNAYKFWEHEQHPILGNTGVIDLLKKLQGHRSTFNYPRKKYYEDILHQLQNNPRTQIIDESWKNILSLQDRFAYDYLCGEQHEAFGYERDNFTPSQIEFCLNEWGLTPNIENPPKTAPKTPDRPLTMEGKEMPLPEKVPEAKTSTGYSVIKWPLRMVGKVLRRVRTL